MSVQGYHSAPVISYQLYNSGSGSATLVQGFHTQVSPPINCTIVLLDQQLQYKAFIPPTCHHLSIVQQQQWISNFSTRLSPLPVTSYLLYNSSSGSQTLVQGSHPNPHLSLPINCTIVVVDHKLQYKALTRNTYHHLSIVQQYQWVTNFCTKLSSPTCHLLSIVQYLVVVDHKLQ